MRMFRLAAAALFPLLAAAQTDRRTFQVIYPATDQDVNEIFTAVRTIADVRGALDAPRQFTIEGTAGQLRAAEWVVRQLDQPAGAPPANSSPLTGIEDRYGEDMARVFYLPQTLSPQEFNEIQTGVRTITDIRRVYPYVSRRAIVVRSNEEALQSAEWLIAALSGGAPASELLYPKEPPSKGDEDNRVRVFHLAPETDVQRFNEVQTMLRTLTETRRVYPYAGKRAIALRGTREQIELSAWILAQIGQELPAQQAGVSTGYTTQNGEVVRLFYFPGAMTVQAFQEAGTRFRAATGIRQAFPFSAARVFAARGTPAQMAQLTSLAQQ